ncbi:hypothetical protein FBU59_000890 [Linderina macrospora]|uniref:Uncharacterized protein n=1 Tax=Linderina macrospora TaxID=4868 RepID=A0ACC1JFS9_9FUNG|nr:hypothetical protein FBU59_000890 [Linderina macrospora]
MELSDLAERVKVKLSDKYEFDFKQPSSDDGTILGIQFSSMFELPPRSIKYVATMLESLAQVGAESAKAIAPVVGLNKAGFGSPANTASVANLIKAVGMLGSDMLGYIADTTKQPSTDPVIQNNAMFRLSDLMRIAPERVNHVTKIILGLGNTDAATAKKFLKDLSWRFYDSSNAQPGLSLHYQ